MLHIIAFNVLLVACLIYGMKFGGWPEKGAIFSQAAAAIVTIFAIRTLPRAAGFGGLAEALAIIDGVLLLAVTGLALWSNRLWTIVLAGLQLSTVIVHASKALYPAFPAASYGIFAQFWAWPMLIVTAIGIYRHHMRTTKFGEELDWKPLWPHSVRAHSRA